MIEQEINFDDLPRALREHILWEMQLDYDHYDSSQAECVHNIANNIGYDYDRNKMNIANYMAGVTKEKLVLLSNQIKQEMITDITWIDVFIRKNS